MTTQSLLSTDCNNSHRRTAEENQTDHNDQIADSNEDLVTLNRLAHPQPISQQPITQSGEAQRSNNSHSMLNSNHGSHPSTSTAQIMGNATDTNAIRPIEQQPNNLRVNNNTTTLDSERNTNETYDLNNESSNSTIPNKTRQENQNLSTNSTQSINQFY